MFSVYCVLKFMLYRNFFLFWLKKKLFLSSHGLLTFSAEVMEPLNIWGWCQGYTGSAVLYTRVEGNNYTSEINQAPPKGTDTQVTKEENRGSMRWTDFLNITSGIVRTGHLVTWSLGGNHLPVSSSLWKYHRLCWKNQNHTSRGKFALSSFNKSSWVLPLLCKEEKAFIFLLPLHWACSLLHF